MRNIPVILLVLLMTLWRVGAASAQGIQTDGNVEADGQLVSNVTTGTPPLAVSSTTNVSNLNADQVDGMEASELANAAATATELASLQTQIDDLTAQLAASRNGQASLNGLRVIRMTASTVDIDADSIQLDNLETTTNVDLTADITVEGTANGLDTGTEATDTWYYVWVVKGTSGVASLLSESSTSPTLPTGYDDAKRRVGAIRNNTAGDFVFLYQIGSVASISSTDDGRVTTSYNPGTTFDTLDLSPFVPPITRRTRISIFVSGSGSPSVEWYYRPKNSGWTTGTLLGMANLSPSHMSQETLVLTDSSQQIEVKTSGSGATASLDVSGWFDPLEL